MIQSIYRVRHRLHPGVPIHGNLAEFTHAIFLFAG